jgi:glycosyltransferase involved in cell wall biosynthesis
MAISGLDVLHSPDFIPPFFRMTWNGIKPSRYASVITIHDLAFLQFPHLLTAESAGYYGQVNHAASSADLIIAVSQSTAQDIETHLGISRQKIRVVYEAANPLYRPLSESELSVMAGKEASKVVEKLAEKRLTPKDSFLLFVSTIEPRKNLPTLLKAFRAMLDELPESDQPMLVIAGREGWLFQDVYNLAQDLKLGKQLVWLGGVSTEELLWLYNKAALLAMPSFYEGFGLPPLESLACGTPVLVADTSSLPEVIGDIGQKIPPLEVKRWKEALLTGWQQRENWKAEALTRGPAQAAKFSWRKAAQETLEIYIEAKNSLRKRNRR